MTEASASLLRGHAAFTASVETFSSALADLDAMAGFLVVDLRGRIVGRVERSTNRASNGWPAALSVRYGFLWLHHRLVAADSIELVDARARVIGLRVERKALGAGTT